jgi:PKD repeat protein
MIKTVLTVLGAISLTLSLQAQQQPNRVIDLNNARAGEEVEYCLTHKKLRELLQNPETAQMIADADYATAQVEANGQATAKAVTLYVPVVFHVLHNNGSENISDEQIYDALEILNRDFDLQNADANNVVNAFNASNPSATSIPSDVDIEFRLATLAPNGECFNGITRTVSTQTSSGNGEAQLNAVVNGNNVYQGVWQHNRYLNIFICEDIGGAAGYTFNPFTSAAASQSNMYYNSIFVLHSYVGSIGTSSTYSSRTLTHEVGHWLNLSHPWGGTNDPGVSCGNDNVSDTPQTIGATACLLSSNTCSGDNAYWGFNQIDQVENYMDYSYCSKMFTPGQVTRMRNALNSTTAGRSNLITTTNLNQTGASGVLTLCKADFGADKTTICAGESVSFDDQTFNAVTGWNWTFAGGSPSASTDPNPIVSYSTPGLYEVSLTATDGTSNDTETKTSYIRVLPSAASLPFVEGFESYSTIDNIMEWGVENPGNNAKFQLETAFGHTGSKCVELPNFGQPVGNVDELLSYPVDLSGINSGTGVTLSFRYAYRKRNTGNTEYLKVMVTNNCGDTWVVRKTIFGDQLSNIVSTSSWAPSSQDDWTTVHMTNVTSSYWVDDFRYKFVFESDGGNNLYLDNINIYAGDPSDELILGINEAVEFADIKLYPNPADNEVNLSFGLAAAQDVTIEITDLTGKVVQLNHINANEGNNLVMMNTSEFAQGSYFLNINAGNKRSTLQFVVK